MEKSTSQILETSYTNPAKYENATSEELQTLLKGYEDQIAQMLAETAPKDPNHKNMIKGIEGDAEKIRRILNSRQNN